GRGSPPLSDCTPVGCVMMVNLVNLFVGVAVRAPAATTAPERSTARSHAALQNRRTQEKGSPGSPARRKPFSGNGLNAVTPCQAGVHHSPQRLHHPPAGPRSNPAG